MGKRKVIGFLYSGKIGKEEKMFEKLAKKNNLDLIFFNTYNSIDENLFKEIEKCDLIYNSSTDECDIEIVKTIEELGKKVIENSKSYYYLEDKWMFYLICKDKNIPTLRTILLSEYIPLAKKELKDFKEWPVVLKRITGTMGEYVQKAENISEAGEIIKSFWKKGSEKLPVIAQELVSSPSYRVTVVDGKIVQTAIKRNTHWKATGVHSKNVEKFKVDKQLKNIVKKVSKAIAINLCGIDLLKKDGKWLVLEVNAQPALDFIDDEQQDMVELVLKFLKKSIKK